MIRAAEMNKKCTYYSIFMEKAYGIYHPSIPGPHFQLMLTLQVAENAKLANRETVPNYEWLLSEVKITILNALSAYINQPNTSEELKEALTHYKDLLSDMENSDELMSIVYEIIELTQPADVEYA